MTIGEMKMKMKMKMKGEKIVWDISNQTVVVEVNNGIDVACLKAIGGKREFFNPKTWKFKYSDKKELANIFISLKEQGFYFLNVPWGWPPYAVFLQLKDEGFLDGTCKEAIYDGEILKTV
jgi:hypothetical protein